MTRNLYFYCRDGRWYADVPETFIVGGTEEDNEMVAGADEWLDFISEGNDRVTLKLSDDKVLNEKLSIYEWDESGATYIAHTYKDEDVNKVIWLCPVTLLIFYVYPSVIYYQKL